MAAASRKQEKFGGIASVVQSIEDTKENSLLKDPFQRS